MDPKERQVIDDLFGKLRQVESRSPQRDPEAEAHIARQVAGLPAAPYYMAQAILVQEQALAGGVGADPAAYEDPGLDAGSGYGCARQG